MELQAIWSRTFNGVTALFIANRYLFFVNLIMQIAFQMPGTASNARFVFSLTSSAMNNRLFSFEPAAMVYIFLASLPRRFQSLLPVVSFLLVIAAVKFMDESGFLLLVIFALRVYALYGQNIWTLVISSLFILQRVALTIWVSTCHFRLDLFVYHIWLIFVRPGKGIVLTEGASTRGSQYQTLSRCIINIDNNELYNT